MSHPDISDIFGQVKRNFDILSVTFLLILLVSMLTVILFAVRTVLFIRQRVDSGAGVAGYLPLH